MPPSLSTGYSASAVPSRAEGAVRCPDIFVAFPDENGTPTNETLAMWAKCHIRKSFICGLDVHKRRVSFVGMGKVRDSKRRLRERTAMKHRLLAALSLLFLAACALLRTCCLSGSGSARACGGPTLARSCARPALRRAHPRGAAWRSWPAATTGAEGPLWIKDGGYLLFSVIRRTSLQSEGRRGSAST